MANRKDPTNTQWEKKEKEKKEEKMKEEKQMI